MSWSQSFNDTLPLLINYSLTSTPGCGDKKQFRNISSSPSQEWMDRLSNSQEESYFSTSETNNSSLFAFSEEADEIFDSFQQFCPFAPVFECANELQNTEDDEFNYNLEGESLSSFLDEEGPPGLGQENDYNSVSTEDDKYFPGGKKSKKSKKMPLQHFHHLPGTNESIQKVSTDVDTFPTPVLWIGNIGQQVTEEELLCAFSRFGNVVNIRILREKYCGFVTFDNSAAASSAKLHLHHTIFGDQAIVINFKRPHSNPIDINFVTNPPSNSLWVGNVSENCTRYDLEKEFAPFGRIESVRVLRNCAFVNFYTVAEAAHALELLQGKKLGNMYLKINYAKQRGTYQHDQSGNNLYTSPTHPMSSLSTSPFNHSPSDPSPPSQSYLLNNTQMFRSNTIDPVLLDLTNDWY